MISLSANTVTLVYAAKRDVVVTIISDSSTVSRIAKKISTLSESSTAGYGLTCNTPLQVRLRAYEEIYAVSTGTPNVTAFDESDDIRAVV